MLQIENISVRYGTTEVLKDILLPINKGEIYSVIGPSGSGKSTLLNVLCGVVKPYKGNILLNNEKLDPSRHNIALVPQQYGLLPWQKVEQNILLPLRIRGGQQTESFRNHFNDIIERLNLSDFLDRYPKELSGGQQQRVALARAFIQGPEVLLMDEPFSALDALTAERSQELFLDLWKKNKTTTLFTTHNVLEAVKMGKHIIVFSTAPGRILRIIENPLYHSGAGREEQDFLLFAQDVKNYIQKEWKIQ
ncbi:MAG: ABC transporter ATP-binding protein [Bacteroidales bacterium]|nr:ABC transporter ATP-binding protein [Bacteroidales bacterium]